MGHGISIEVSRGSKERVSRRWGIHSRSVYELSSRCGSRGLLPMTIETADPAT